MSSQFSSKDNKARLAITIPCYNEEEALDEAISQLLAKLEECVELQLISAESFLLFVDDGSQDKTWEMLTAAHQRDPQRIKVAQLAANRGKDFALWAALMEAKDMCDIAIAMDADLQFDIHAVNRFIEKYNEGYEIVYGIKENRGKQSIMRDCTALFFYWAMQKLGTAIERNQADYCLMTSQALEALSDYNEAHLFFRGLLKTIGFKTCSLQFTVLDRAQGESKFSLFSLLNLSLDAITSFSVRPLRLIGALGFFIFIISIFMIIWVFIDFFLGKTVTGWATLNVSIWLIGGLSMMSMAVLGEYIGKGYMESKKRPRYFIKNRKY